MRGPWAGVQCVCAWHACPQVKVKNIPYRHRTLRSSAGRVLIIGQACSVRGVCGRADGVGGQVGVRGGGGGGPWERRWHSTRSVKGVDGPKRRAVVAAVGRPVHTLHA